MGDQEKYVPTEEEVAAAEEDMWPEQRNLSEKREKYLEDFGITDPELIEEAANLTKYEDDDGYKCLTGILSGHNIKFERMLTGSTTEYAIFIDDEKANVSKDEATSLFNKYYNLLTNIDWDDDRVEQYKKDMEHKKIIDKLLGKE